MWKLLPSHLPIFWYFSMKFALLLMLFSFFLCWRRITFQNWLTSSIKKIYVPRCFWFFIFVLKLELYIPIWCLYFFNASLAFAMTNASSVSSLKETTNAWGTHDETSGFNIFGTSCREMVGAPSLDCILCTGCQQNHSNYVRYVKNVPYTSLHYKRIFCQQYCKYLPTYFTGSNRDGKKDVRKRFGLKRVQRGEMSIQQHCSGHRNQFDPFHYKTIQW